MPKISIAQAGDINLCAFLDLIAWAEGTSSTVHRLTRMDGYDVIVTGSCGPEIFTDFQRHPFSNARAPKHITGSLFSSASGRYQFMRTHWEHYRNLLKLPDFGPLSQDLWAIQLIRERNALHDIRQHRIREAISRCANIWASFPGAGYGQPEHKMERLIDVFEEALERLSINTEDMNDEPLIPPETKDIPHILIKLSTEIEKIRLLLEAYIKHN